jgi:type VI protein secretion system component Hcp
VPSIEVKALSWRAADALQPEVMTSDPQEGGEIARKAVRKTTKPAISEMTVSKRTDSSSPKILSVNSGGEAVEPGKLEYPNVTMNGSAADPPAAGTATIVVARGHCASGQHFPAVKLTMRGESHTLQDVDVVSCTAVDDKSDGCTLKYASVSG